MAVTFDQALPRGEIQERNALLRATTSDSEEVFAIGFREAAVAFGNVGNDGQGCAVELVGEEKKYPRGKPLVIEQQASANVTAFW